MFGKKSKNVSIPKPTCLLRFETLFIISGTSRLEFQTPASNFVVSPVSTVYHFVEERRVPFLRRAIRQSGSKRIARWAITKWQKNSGGSFQAGFNYPVFNPLPSTNFFFCIVYAAIYLRSIVTSNKMAWRWK